MENSKIKIKNKGIIIFTFCILIFTMVCLSITYAMSRATGDNQKEREVFVGVFREGAPANMNYIKKF